MIRGSIKRRRSGNETASGELWYDKTESASSSNEHVFVASPIISKEIRGYKHIIAPSGLSVRGAKPRLSVQCVGE
jgi:hypothetical protein